MVFLPGQPELTIGCRSLPCPTSSGGLGGGSLRKADPGVWWEPTLTPRFFARGPSQHLEVNAVRTCQCLAAGASEVASWRRRPISGATSWIQ
jgi:hypothetical protein